MGIVTVRHPSISWCRCKYRPLCAGGQDQTQVEKECQEKTISSLCSGKAEKFTNITQIRVGALKPFHSTSGRPVHRREMGTLQHQREGPWPVQKLLLEAKEAQTESAGYQTEPGTLSVTGRRQRREKIRHLQEQEHRLKLSTIANLTRR